jgi:hypothetical protein
MEAWAFSDAADRDNFERLGGVVHTSALSGHEPPWRPNRAVDEAMIDAAFENSDARGATRVPTGVEEVIRGLKAAADDQSRLAHDVLELRDGKPEWADDIRGDLAKLDDEVDEDQIPRRSLLDVEPSYEEPLREYCIEALSRCDESAIAAAIEQWVGWGVDGYLATLNRKRPRTEDEGVLENEKPQSQVAVSHVGCASAPPGRSPIDPPDKDDVREEGASDQEECRVQVDPSRAVEAITSLGMLRRRRLVSPPTPSPEGLHLVSPPTESASPMPPYVIAREATFREEQNVVEMPAEDLIKVMRGTVRVLKDAVQRERRLIRRYCGEGLQGLVGFHAKEANTAATIADAYRYPSIPLIDSVREQHGRVIGAYDALSHAQARFVDAQREARVALEDAAEAVQAISVERQAMATLLRSTAVECNSVEEIRQLLLQELRSLKSFSKQR